LMHGLQQFSRVGGDIFAARLKVSLFSPPLPVLFRFSAM